MKKYRVWGYETVPYHIDLDALNIKLNEEILPINQ